MEHRLLIPKEDSNETEQPQKRSFKAITISGLILLTGLGALASKSYSTSSVASPSLVEDSSSSNSDLGDIKLVVHREGYGPVTDNARALYGFEHIAEPYVTNHFKITNLPETDADLHTYDWSVEHLEGPSAGTFKPLSIKGGLSAQTFTFDQPTDVFSLNIIEYDPTGAPSRVFTTSNLITKFVKREIRTITDEDREKYLNALHTMYTVEDSVGKALYGDNYISHAHLAALHSTKSYQFHANTFFLTSHPAITLKVERSLLTIDSSVVLTYWDFFNDAELGGDWVKSDVYKEDWFGSVENGKADEYRIRGRFRDVKVIYDPDETTFPDANHGAYGFLTDSYSTSTYLQRTDSVCGFKSKQGFSTCGLVEKCLDQFVSGELSGLFMFDDCLETNAHGTLHGMHGGMWDCAVDFNDFYEDNKDWVSEGLMSFISMEIVVCNDFLKGTWSNCETSGCSVNDDGDDSECGCSPAVVSSLEEVDEMTSSEVYSYFDKCLESPYEVDFRGKTYIEKVDGVYRWKGMDDDQNDKLSKLMLKVAAYGGSWATFNSGAATTDPLFFVMHQVFDKILHIVRLSPKYNRADLTWTPVRGADGTGWLSKTPFSSQLFEPYLGAHGITKDGSIHDNIRNKELWKYLKPDSKSLPYVYDELSHFGKCDVMKDDR